MNAQDVMCRKPAVPKACRARQGLAGRGSPPFDGAGPIGLATEPELGANAPVPVRGDERCATIPFRLTLERPLPGGAKRVREWIQAERQEPRYAQSRGCPRAPPAIACTAWPAGQRAPPIGWKVRPELKDLFALVVFDGAGVARAPSPEEARSWMTAHLEWRRHLRRVEHPECGRHRYPGHPFRLSATPPRFDSPAPLLGQRRRNPAPDRDRPHRGRLHGGGLQARVGRQQV